MEEEGKLLSKSANESSNAVLLVPNAGGELICEAGVG